MNKREFIKKSLLAGAATPLAFTAIADHATAKNKYKHWIWVNPKQDDKDEYLNSRYKNFYSAGVRGIFFEADSEKHYRIAKQNKLEAHRWMWILNRGEKELLASHPEWYAVNRKGESSADKPAYVQYYRWLCPSREEVHQYIDDHVRATLQKNYVDGIHLDYVRYCDVILPVNLWDKYKIDQTRELPEYDYCYCDVCRKKFKEVKGIDPLDIQYPDQSLSWRNYRYNNVTRLVNRLSSVASSYKKPITAAVFPTPEIARRIVRQDWTRWNLNAIYPMIYHGFYKEDVAWIGDAVSECVHGLCGKFPVYAGLYLPDFKNMEELSQGIQYALKNGASGVSIFGNVNDDVLAVVRKVSLNRNTKG